jgi:predicted DNA-binding transcriptional regulator YafY
LSYRTDLTARLIEIPFRLAQHKCSRQTLARDFGVDAKTISRDIDALGNQYPIIARRIGREVFYEFADGFEFKFPQLSISELATLLLAQESIAGIGMTAPASPYAAFADSLLEKVRTSLPRSIREKMDALAQVYGSAAVPAKDFSKHSEIIEQLASCAVREKRLRIRYHALNTNREEARILEPYAVYFDPDGATLKLIAFDPKHDSLRVFSVDRITAIKELDQKFKRPAGFDLKKYLDENCFNGIHGETLTVHLKATGVTARIFSERKFHPSQKVIERKQKRGGNAEEITIEMRVARGRGLHRFILSYLPEIEVVAPAELRAEIAELLKASLTKTEAKKSAAKV